VKSSKNIVSEALAANSIEDLKVLGSAKEICKALNEVYCPFELSADTYEQIFTAVEAIRSSLINLKSYPFVSRAEEVIFCLTEVDSPGRNARLGVEDQMYRDKILAKKWYKSIAQIVHSDKTGGDSRPMQALQELYEEITHEGVGDE